MAFFHKNLRFLLTLVMSGLLCLFLYKADYGFIHSQVLEVGVHFGWILLSTFIAYFCATIAWKYSFGPDATLPSVVELFCIRQAGESIAIITPLNVVAGEATKYGLLKGFSIDKREVFSSLIISRVTLIGTYIFIAIITFFHFLPSWKQRFLVIIVSALLVLLCYFIVRKFFSKLVLLFKRKEWLRTTGESLQKVRLHMRSRPKLFTWVVLFSVLHWIIGVFEFYIILNAIDIPCTYGDALLLEMGVMIFKSMGAFIPGQIGIEELGNKIMLSFMSGIDPAIWIVVSAIRRGRQLFWVLLGLFFLLVLTKTQSWKYST